jgi:predicted Zn-dependent protease
VQGGVFYQPDLQIQFPVPSGWQVANFATQVQMAPSAGDAAIIMTAMANADPATAANQFVQANKAQVVSGGPTTIGGFSAYQIQSNISVDDGNGGTAVLTALSAFISKGGALYVFHGYADQARFSSYASTFQSVEAGFAQVTNQAVLAVQPSRLQVFKAPRTDQFAALVQPSAQLNFSVNDLAILNERQVGDQVTAGTSLKQVQP